MSIKSNIKELQKELGSEVKLIAVTKGRSAKEVQEAIEAGITDIGESRLQEALTKLPNLPSNPNSQKPITKHFIGRLQTNKVKEVVGLFDVIQSVDSLKLAQKISLECGKIGKTMPILIQINTSAEHQKGGVAIEGLDELIEEVTKLPNIILEGLMTIAVRSDDESDVRNCFRRLNEKYMNLKLDSEIRIQKSEMRWLSAGMSGDYKIAIEEGSNMVRIGRGVFDS